MPDNEKIWKAERVLQSLEAGPPTEKTEAAGQTDASKDQGEQTESKSTTEEKRRSDRFADFNAERNERWTDSAEEESRDPTTPFQFCPLPKVAVPEDSGHWSEALRERRMLLLSSYDSELLYAISWAIIQHAAFSGCERRILRSDQIDVDMNEFLASTTVSKPRVVVVYAIDSAKFVESLHPGIDVIKHQQGQLQKKNIYLLIAAEAQHWIPVEQRDRGRRYSYAEPMVDFLVPRLRAAFPDQANQLASTLRVQRSRGHWSRSEREFYIEIADALEDRSLLRRIDEIDNAVAEGKEDGLRARRLPVSALQLLEKVRDGDSALQQLYQWVFFTATFFPKLPIDEFSKILKCVVPAPPPVPPSNDKEAAKPRPSLYDAWAYNEPQILKLCQMRQEPRPLEPPTIGFIEDVLLSEMRMAFLATYFGHYTRALNSIAEAGLIVDPSPLIRDRLREVLADRAIREPNYAGTRYVLDILRSFVAARRVSQSTPPLNGEISFELEDLPNEMRNVLFQQIAGIIIAIAGKAGQDSVAVDGLLQLKGIGVLRPVRLVLNRFSRTDIPASVLAVAARILLSSTDEPPARETLVTLRRILWQPEKGQVLPLLIGSASTELACNIVRYLTQYSLMGFRSDAKSNPVAVALADIAQKPGFDRNDIQAVVKILVSDSFRDGFDDEVSSVLFHSWLVPGSLFEKAGSFQLVVFAALNRAAERMNLFLATRSDRGVPPHQLWIPALMFVDVYLHLDDATARSTLAQIVRETAERVSWTELLALLNELANAINDAVVILQTPAPTATRADLQQRMPLLERWKRLRDALRKLRTEIGPITQSRPASA